MQPLRVTARGRSASAFPFSTPSRAGRPWRRIALATAAALLPWTTEAGAAPLAAPQPASATTAELDEVTVTATRSATALKRTPASVSVITSEDIEEQQADNIKDALRYEPGVTVRRAPYRPGSAATGGGRDGDSSINIRGLEGNRILLMEDGIRLPSAFSFGPLEAGRGDYAGMDMLKRIEILRGPASVLYGSDGLTGAVNFITKDPQDFLDIFGKPTYFSLKSGYDSTDRSFGGTAVAAFGGERVQGMIIANGRRSHEVDSQGENDTAGVNRTAANPQQVYTTSLLGKLLFKATPQDTFKLSAESVERRVDTDVLSAVNPPTTLGLSARDKLTRERFSLDYDFDDAGHRLFQQAHAQLYFQQARNRQYAYEWRTAGDRTRDNLYEERTIGGSAQAQSRFTTGPLAHQLLYGFDASVAKISNLRNGTVPGVGEAPFPNKAFPDTDYTLFGTFVQDEIHHGALSIVPGLRLDAYRLSPQSNDALYTGTPSGSHDHALSPRLAVLYEISPALIPYVQYARGFRTPTPDQVNNSFANPIYGYTSIGNPHLKPETSDTVEIGLRGKLRTRTGPLTYSVAAFAGRYRDFISQQIVRGSGRPFVDPLVFQYVNYARADIRGVEARGQWQLPGGIGIRAALAYTHGTIDNDGQGSQPLDTINPFSAVLGLRYEPTARWFAQADLLFQAAKRASDVPATDCNNATCFTPPSSLVLDLSAGYHFNKYATAYLSVHNVFDRKYWNWSDVRGLADTSPVKDAYTAPGRSVALTLKLQY